ncbi:hypothetical protein CAI21_15180 [Alkalilimnicola ehrlichii]|uniref:PET hydrolase/cutinase-like domain-containing protein n=1 Tax=Alkalilimnicola ehrlichii TaxID=351052 RepID=A0A3E0WQW9_9GAMM|nr:hypothetical protein [Alkalilimnicola ehrlichii]RFA27190.1 hypothetical protein CAI21_15180 [Alkalilimnicola ehrlichii]RFA35362.1 hypothetical protein CAL65_12835 [Alkalilimnicola ehrlichii]
MLVTTAMQKALVIGAFIGLLPLSAGAFNPGTPDPEPPPPVGDGILPPVERVDADGPFQTTIERNTGPSRSGWVVRPTNLGEHDIQHPVFIWGPGAGTRPSSYEDHLRRIASHGFVVYSEVSTNTGREMTAAIDWLIAEDARSSSPYFQKLDTTRIAAGGHSRGSIASFAIGSDPRLSTTIHVAGGSFDGRGSANLHKPAAYICGANDRMATSNCRRDYTNTQVPVWFTVMRGSDHMGAARDGLPIIVAWLRWHLAGETERSSMFLDRNCDFCGFGYDTQHKNW